MWFFSSLVFHTFDTDPGTVQTVKFGLIATPTDNEGFSEKAFLSNNNPYDTDLTDPQTGMAPSFFQPTVKALLLWVIF
jgi:hypothetical protein